MEEGLKKIGDERKRKERKKNMSNGRIGIFSLLRNSRIPHTFLLLLFGVSFLSLFLAGCSGIRGCAVEREGASDIPPEPYPISPENIVKDDATSLSVVKNEVLIVLKEGESISDVLDELRTLTGADVEVIGGVPELRLIQVRVNADTPEEVKRVAELVRDSSRVSGASPNFVFSGHALSLNGYYVPDDAEWASEVWNELSPEGRNWAFEFIRAPSAWRITQGEKNVKVGVVDWGFNPYHEDLRENVGRVTEVGGYAFLNPRHGTLVAGIIGAEGDNRIGVSGVMWRASLELCRQDGSLAGVAFCILKLAREGVRVINFSGGLSWEKTPSEKNPENIRVIELQNSVFRQVFSHPAMRRVLFVQSAGNGGYSSKWAGAGAPLRDEFENILVVGSVSPQGKRSAFSNTDVDIFAPGEMIFSTCNQGYCADTGTSFAAPFVSGAAGLLLSLYNFSPSELKDLIVKSGYIAGRIEPSEKKPILDVYGAISEADMAKDGLINVGDTGGGEDIPDSEQDQISFWEDVRDIFFEPEAVGGLKWSYNLGAPSDAPAAVDSSGNVYVGNDNGVLVSLDSNGNLRWQVDIPTLPGSCACTIKGAPAIDEENGRVFVACGPNVWAFDTSNGNTIWGQKTGPIYGAPAIDFSGNVVVVTKKGKVINLDGGTGTLNWSLQLSGELADSSPSIDPRGNIYVATRSDGKLHSISRTGTLNWTYSVGDVKGGVAFACDGTIYVGNKSGTLYALNPDGTLKWSLSLGGEIKSTPAVDGSFIYVASGNKLYKVQDSGSVGGIVWSYTASGNTRYSSPAISSENLIYFADELGYVYAVTDTGALQWSYSTGAEIRNSPVIGPDGTVYVSARDGVLYAITSAGGVKDTSWSSVRYDSQGTGRGLLCTPTLNSIQYSAGDFIISWSDVAGEDGYKVWRKIGTGLYSVIGQTAADTTSFTDTSLQEGQQHCYQVQATNQVGASKKSNELCDWAPPNIPSGLDAYSVSSTQVQVVWTDNSSVEDTYHIERKIGTGSWALLADLSANTTSYLDENLTEGTQYCYRVSASVLTPGGRKYSDYSNQDCDTTPPNPPENPNAVSQSATQIYVWWTDASGVEDGYKVERREKAGGVYVEIADLPANSTDYVDTGLNPATEYCYRIRAYKGTKFSDYSPEVCEFTDEAPTSPPAAPSDLTVHDYDSYSVTLTWVDNSDNEDWFIIERKVGAAGTYAELASTPANVTQYTDSSVSEGQTYYYRVSAANLAGYSAFSNEVNVTIPLLPADSLSASAPDSTQVSLTWNDNSSLNTGYKIYRRAGAGSYSLLANVGDVTSYSDSTVSTETQYCYVVTATAGGNPPDSGPSNETCITVLAAPSGLAATALSSSEIQLTWTDNSANEDFYEIWRKKGVSGTYAKVAEIACSGSCSYTDTGLLSSTTYYYKVRARKGTNSFSSYSNEVNATTLGPSASACASASAGIFSTGVTYGNIIIYGSKDGNVYAVDRGTCSVQWQFNTGGQVWASPATLPGKVYIGSRSGYLFALDPATGSEIWRCKLGGGMISSVAVKDGNPPTIYVGARDRKLYAVQDNGSSCTILWIYDITADCAGFSGQIDSSPLVDPQGNIYFGSSNGYLYSVNSVGTILWKTYIGQLVKKPVFSSPAMSCQGKIYVVAKEFLFEIDYATGTTTGYFQIGTPGAVLLSSPTVTTDTVFVGGSDGVYAIWITASSLTQRWKYTTPSPVTTAPAVSGNDRVLFADANGNFYSVRLTDGVLDWSGSVAAGAIFSSPVITSGYAWVGSEDSGIYKISIGVVPPEEGVYAYPKFRYNFGNKGWFAPGLCAPWGLTIAYAYPGNVTLTWNGVNVFADVIDVERSTDGTTWTDIADATPGSTTQYTDTTASEGQTYWWRVKARNTLGSSAYSNVVSATLPPYGPTSLVANLSVTAPHAEINLSWTDNSAAEDGFYVERSLDGNTFSKIATLPADSNAYDDNFQIQEVTTYWYRVVAFKLSVLSEYSNTVSITTAPNPPTGSVAVAIDHETISVSWYDNSAKEDGYEVWRKEGASGVYQAVATLAADTTSWTDTGRTPNTTYCYKVRAFVDLGGGNKVFSAFDTETCTTTPSAPPSPPSAPSNLTSYAISSTQVVLTWQDNSGTEDGFRIERSTWGSVYQEIATVPANTITFTDTATSDDRHCYRVKAYNAYGESSPSNVTCQTLIAMPSDLDPTAASTTQIDLTWQDNSTQNTGYEIWYSTDDGNTYSLLANIGDVSSYSHTGLSEAQKVWYKIRAHANSITYSSFLTPVVGYTKPNAPTSLSIVLTTATAIKLSWVDNSGGEHGYRLQRCQGAGCSNFQDVADLPADSESYTDTGLSPNTTYCYRVSAYVGGEFSDFSNTVCGSTASSGTISWTFSTGGPVFSSPAIDNGIVYIGSNDGKLYALEATSGNLLWSYTTGGPVRSSPAVGCGGEIYFGSDDGYLYSLTGAGTLRWKVQLSSRRAPIVSSPALHPEGTTVYVAATNHRVYAVEATNGNVKWVSNPLPRPLRTSPFLSPDGATVYVIGVDNLYAFDAQTGTQKWSLAIRCTVRTSPAVTPDGTIYIKGDDTLYKIRDNGTSASVVWQVAVGMGESTPAVDDAGNIYVGGGIDLKKISPSGTVLSQYTALGMVNSHPTFATDSAGNTVFFADGSGNFYAVDSANMSLRWSQNLGGTIRISPNISKLGGVVVVASSNGNVYGIATSEVIPEKSPGCPKFQGDVFQHGATRSCPIPGSPDPITAWASSSTQINVRWTDKFDIEDGFEIWKRQVGVDTDYVLLDSLPANTTEYAHQNLPEVVTVYYMVRAFADGNYSGFTTEVSAITFPKEPTGLVTDTISASSITLTWYDNSLKEEGFEVERRVSSSTLWSVVKTFFQADVTEYQDTGLSENVEYCYRVRTFALSGAVKSLPSSESCSLTRLNTPTALNATAIGPNQIDLEWQDNSTQETSYEIWRKGPSDPDYILLTTIPGLSGTGLLTYSDTNVNSNSTYYYKVRATRTSPTNWSEFSNSASATTPAQLIPDPPSNLTTYTYSSTQINLTWQDNSDNEDGFKVLRCQGVGCDPATQGSVVATVPADPDAPPDTDTYEDLGLSEYTDYCYCVSAYNTYGDSACSNTSCSKTFPHAPTNLTGAVAPGKITLYFIDNSAVEDGFRIERREENGGTYTEIAVISASAGSGNQVIWEDTTITPGIDYCYRVRAYAGSTNSLYSNSWCTGTNLLAPSDLTASAYPGGVTVSWTDNSTGEDGTEVWRCEGAGCTTFAKIGTSPANITYFIDTSVTDEGYYCYKARSYKGIADFSEWSNIGCVDLGLLAPSALRIYGDYSSSSSSTAQLTWQDNSAKEDKYYVELSQDGSSFSVVATFPAGTTLGDIQDLQEGQWYWFRVKAANVSTESTYSNTVSMKAPPYKPANVSVMGGSLTSSVVITWTDNSLVEEGFVLKRRKQGDTTFNIITVPAGKEFYEDSVTEGYTWCYSVSSYLVEVTSGGSTVRSSGDTSEVCKFVIATPTPLYVEYDASTGNVKLTWQDNSLIEDGFSIERKAGGGTWGQIATVGQNVDKYTDSTVSANQIYCYRVRAYRGTDYSAYSEEKCVSTYAAGTLIRTISLDTITTLAASPYLGDVYAGVVTGAVYSIDVGDGTINWAYNTGSRVNEICALEVGTKVMIGVATEGGKFVLLNELGEFKGERLFGEAVKGCAISKDKIFVVTASGNLYALGYDLSQLWNVSTGVSTTSSPVVGGGKVVIKGSTSVCAYNTSDGSAYWTPSACKSISGTQITTELSMSSSGDLFAGTQDGRVLYISSDGADVFLGDVTSPAPGAITGAISTLEEGGVVRLAIPTQGGALYLAEITSLSGGLYLNVLWWKTVGTGSPQLKSAPTIGENLIIQGNSLGDIFAYRITTGVEDFSNTVGTLSVDTSPVSIDGVVVFSEGANLRFVGGGDPIRPIGWVRDGGNATSSHNIEVVSRPRWVVQLEAGFPSCPTSDEVYAAPMFFNTDGAGNMEILVNSSGVKTAPGVMYSVRSDGFVLWQTNLGEKSFGSSAVGDPDGDGTQEVVVGSSDGVRVLNISTGAVEFTFSTTANVGTVVLYDIDADGRDEIIFNQYSFLSEPVQHSEFVIAGYNGTSIVEQCKYQFQNAERVRTTPVVVSSGGNIYIVVPGKESGLLYVFNGTCGVVRTVDMKSGNPEAILNDGFITDFDGDGDPDFIGGRRVFTGTLTETRVHVVDILTGTILKDILLGTHSEAFWFRSAVPLDLDGDGVYERGVFVESKFDPPYDTSYLSVVNLSAGSVEWRKQFNFRVLSASLSGDFDYDGSKEVILFGSDNAEDTIYMFSAGDGTLEKFWPLDLVAGEVVKSASSHVADIDSDGKLEMVVAGSEGCIYVFEFGADSAKGVIDTPQYKKNPSRNALW